MKELKRAEVAERLGVSVYKIRCMEGVELHPTKVGGKYLFDRAEVDSVARRFVKKGRRRKLTDGQIAARAFVLFDEGADLRAVVVQLEVTPAEVHDLWREWSRPDLELAARRREEEAERVRKAKKKKAKKLDPFEIDMKEFFKSPPSYGPRRAKR